MLIAFSAGLGAGLLVAVFTQRAAYYNGVTDGYGYSQEPKCPGYAAAGDYLHKVMAHRWPVLQIVKFHRDSPIGGGEDMPGCGCETNPGWRCPMHDGP